MHILQGSTKFTPNICLQYFEATSSWSKDSSKCQYGTEIHMYLGLSVIPTREILS